jgi:chromosome segregation ATPase
MTQKHELKTRLAELEQQIKETEKRLPAHSVKPQIMTELFELEDEYEAVLAQLNALKADPPDSKE